MIKIGILEDDLDIKRNYLRYLNGVDNIEVVVEASSVEEFTEKMQAIPHLDVVLSDIGLPGKSGIEGIFLIKQQFPTCNILMFTVYNDPERIFKSLCAGATGYLLKNTPLPKVKKAIEDIHNGDGPMSPSIARKVIEYFSPQKTKIEAPLTPREHQVVQALVEGLSYKMIAARFDISFETVKQHVKNIYKKLHVNCKAEVIAKALKGEL